VYYQASCDLMHPGVIARLKKAKEQGDFLYVGLWSDEMIKFYCGSQYPIVSLSERILMTLSCKYVDDIVIGAPFMITKDLVKSLNLKKIINVVS
jgi:ethanolamine-phosphate cytidylyltransferase